MTGTVLEVDASMECKGSTEVSNGLLKQGIDGGVLMDDGESFEHEVVGVISDIMLSSILSLPECSTSDVLSKSAFDVDGMGAFFEQGRRGGGGGGGGSCASKRFSSISVSESDE